MKISVGTQNKGKLEAVKNALSYYEKYSNSEIIGAEVKSGVSNQPKTIDETITGAKNRAKNAYHQKSADLGIGLESGIFSVNQTKSGYMDTTVCAIFDGKNFHLGLSSCFEYPKKMIEMIFQENKEISDIAIELGFTNDRAFREDSGMIGILTKGILTRTKYSEQAVHTAMIHLLNKGYY